MSDPYTIVKVYNTINRGGFGIIDRVKLNNGNHAARKTFSPKDFEQYPIEVIGKLRNRFIKEVLIQQQLPIDFVIPILNHDLSGDHPWFIMPLADRVYSDEIETAKMEQRQPDGLSDILNAMETIHGLGYVHRDIKPQNILFHDGRWKLADFGLISSDASVLSKFSTSAGDRGGTEMYMAPEQYKNFKNAPFQADIYSFGAILHDIFGAIKRTPYSELNAPGAIGFIIQKCTLENPRKRFQSISELRSVLLTILEKFNTQVTEDESEWINKLKLYLEWDEIALEQFSFGIERLESKRGVFIELTEDHFTQFGMIDVVHFENIVGSFLEWINDSTFHYDYCDVLIHRILNIYEISENVDIKCKCILAATELGAHHNRWYVMHRVVGMVDKDISDNLARRISIELQIDHKIKNQFERCIQEISLSPSRCHPIISGTLSEV